MIASTLLINELIPIPQSRKGKKKKKTTVHILEITEIKI